MFRRTLGKDARPYGARGRLVHAAGAALLALGLTGAAPQPRELHILALGDSLTAGFGLPRSQGFVPQLEAYLRRQGVRAHIVNAGVSGDTAAQGQQRLAWTLDGMEAPPQLAIVALGANDMLRGLDPAQTRAALDAILTELDRRNIRVLMAGMVASPNMGEAYGTRFNAIYPDLARQHGAVLQPFFLDGVAGDRALNQQDGIHPNFAGVRKMVVAVAPRVAEAAGN